MTDVAETKEERKDIPLTEEQIKEAWSLLSDKDPETGLTYDWLTIRDVLMNEGVAKGLPMIFEYYNTVNTRMDPYINYMLACSHFTSEELGDPQTRTARKKLQQQVKKLIKKRAEHPHENIFKFYNEHATNLK